MTKTIHHFFFFHISLSIIMSIHDINNKCRTFYLPFTQICNNQCKTLYLCIQKIVTMPDGTSKFTEYTCTMIDNNKINQYTHIYSLHTCTRYYWRALYRSGSSQISCQLVKQLCYQVTRHILYFIQFICVSCIL